ncbi:RteC domain-containing protein, partial [Mesonia sp. K4-1]|uniref:RteC domain-containing protein n=1 Tax=Mesonia sp. K4-1 TaxID=2602760 RepID=UPI0021043CF5
MKHAEEIIEKFTTQMDSLKDENEKPLRKANQGISLCSKALSQLKTIVEKQEFKTIAAEIHFFKTIKSIPMSYLIYFTELRTCELQKPKAGVRYQINFLEKELKKINKFFYRNSDFVYYMELGHTYLDHQFFARK